VKLGIFDLDGTLLDSDDALADAFVRCGVDRSQVTFGHVVADECERLGISASDYVAAYDRDAAQPYPGVEEVLAALDGWALVSNKDGPIGRAELARLGWAPTVACFSDDFRSGKDLGCVLERVALGPGDVVYVGDTDHDRLCAERAGVDFALAGWNQRVTGRPGDVVLARPGDVLDLLRD
jgi:HAD superfamily hydrolase (TIGR01549 family)